MDVRLFWDHGPSPIWAPDPVPEESWHLPELLTSDLLAWVRDSERNWGAWELAGMPDPDPGFARLQEAGTLLAVRLAAALGPDFTVVAADGSRHRGTAEHAHPEAVSAFQQIRDAKEERELRLKTPRPKPGDTVTLPSGRTVSALLGPNTLHGNV